MLLGCQNLIIFLLCTILAWVFVCNALSIDNNS